MDERFVLALAGGVGGGKLARGLAAVLPPDQLAIVVNTADDFVHLGLHISPDVDSVLYALADQNDLERGWGLAGETWKRACVVLNSTDSADAELILPSGDWNVALDDHGAPAEQRIVSGKINLRFKSGTILYQK